MTKLLVIKSSVTGAASVTNGLIDRLVDRLRVEVPGLSVTERDLDAAPVPHLSSATLGGIGRGEMSEGSAATRVLSDAMIAELQEADMLVIGAPMYNFGIPSTLKSWFDHVLRAGVTFQYGADGPKGLVRPKPVVVVEARGGFYSEGPASVMDAQEPHLKGMLGFMGLSDVEFVRIERLAFGPDVAGPAIETAALKLAGIELTPALAA
jgi:FMN-dependent NADH-azoreductase